MPQDKNLIQPLAFEPHDAMCELLSASDATLLGGFQCGCAERAKQFGGLRAGRGRYVEVAHDSRPNKNSRRRRWNR